MNLLFCLEAILSDFRHLFNQQNFALFKTLIFGFIANTHGGTLTRLYQSSFPRTRYWSFAKFLSRGKWDADAVAAHLIRRIQQVFTHWVYVYDETKALKTGKAQYGLHFFRTSATKSVASISQSSILDTSWEPWGSYVRQAQNACFFPSG